MIRRPINLMVALEFRGAQHAPDPILHPGLSRVSKLGDCGGHGVFPSRQLVSRRFSAEDPEVCSFNDPAGWCIGHDPWIKKRLSGE